MNSVEMRQQNETWSPGTKHYQHEFFEGLLVSSLHEDTHMYGPELMESSLFASCANFHSTREAGNGKGCDRKCRAWLP